MTEERKMHYLMKFEGLIDVFDENDSVSIEDVNAEIHKHWTHYLSAGCDANKVVKMMSPMDVFKNYISLRIKGAYIDISKLAKDVTAYILENSTSSSEYDDFVQENLMWFLSQGLSVEEIADYISDCYERETFIYNNFDAIKGQADLKTLSKIILNCHEERDFDEACVNEWMYEEYTGKNLDIILLAEYATRHGIDYCGADKFVIEFCDKLKENDASEELIKLFFDLLDGHFYYTIFTHNRIEWLKQFDGAFDLGVEKVAEYLDEGEYGCSLEKLPEEVLGPVARKWYGNMPIRELGINSCEYDSFSEFLRVTKLDIDFLVEKFLKEDGYENCVDFWLPYSLFQKAPTKLDARKVVQKILVSKNPEFFEEFYDVLKKLGVDEKIIAPLLEN